MDKEVTVRQEQPVPKPDRELHWRTHVAAWRVSKLSQAGYCREHGLAPADLSWWKHELARRDGKRKAERSPSKSKSTNRKSKQAFVPLRISTGTPQAEGYEVVLRGGRIIRMAASFDEASLKRLIAVLENSAC